MGTRTLAQVFLRNAKNIAIVLICSFVWITVLLPFLALPLSILFMIRKLVNFIVLHKHPTYKPITGIEAIYAGVNKINYSDKPSNCFATICTAVEIDGHFSAEEIRERAESTVFRNKNVPNWPFWKLQSTPVKCFGYYYWETFPSINLKEYIIEGPPHFQELDQILNEWLPLRFEGENRSPWEGLVCQPKVGKYAGKTLIFLKGSHSMVDVVGARDIVLAFLGMTSQETVNPDVVKVPPLMAAFHFITIPRMVLDTVVGWLMQKWETKSNLVFNGDCNNGDSVNLWGSVDLDQIKRIKRKLRCSFKVVLSCTVGSALRQHMLDTNSKALESDVSVLLNTHWPHAPHPGSLAVEATSFFVKLNLSEDNSRERIVQFQSAVRSKLEIGTYKFVYYASHINYVLPSFLTPSLGQRNIGKAYSETDIPFTVGRDLYYQDVPVPGVYINVGLQGVPLTSFFCFTTVGSKVCVAITANKAFVKTAQELEKVFQVFRNELDILDSETPDKVEVDEESHQILPSAP